MADLPKKKESENVNTDTAVSEVKTDGKAVEKAKKPAKDKVPFSQKIASFFRGYKSEAKRIVWSPWNQVRKNSLVVIVVVVVCAAAVCALDFAFSKGLIALSGLI